MDQMAVGRFGSQPPNVPKAKCPNSQVSHILGICPGRQMSPLPFVICQMARPPHVLAAIWGNSHLSLTAICQTLVPIQSSMSNFVRNITHFLVFIKTQCQVCSSFAWRWGKFMDIAYFIVKKICSFRKGIIRKINKGRGETQLLLSIRYCLQFVN